MKTRVITAAVGIAVLVLVMLTFNTLVFNLIVAAVASMAGAFSRFPSRRL